MSKFLSLQVTRPILIGSFALFAAFLINFILFDSNEQKGGYKGNDIFFIFSDGKAIAHGENPYSKIHGSDMLQNNKYSTYLPGFFLLVSAFVSLGYDTFQEWLAFWKPMGFAIHFMVGVALFFYLLRTSGFWLAIFGSQFWLLSRWPVQIMKSGQIDALAILLLLISLFLWPRFRRASLILFGASLSIKQIGIFMLPVYLLLGSDLQQTFIWNLKQGLRDLMYILIVPFIVCLPFLIWDASGLFLSILFSATRSPGGHIKVPGIDELLGMVGLVAKLPMLFMLASIYFLVLQRNIGRFAAGLAIYLVFMSFNSVLLKQYLPWFCAFLGLALSEIQVRSIILNQGRDDEGAKV